MDGVVTVTIKSNKQIMSKEFELLSVDTTREVNRVPTAQLVLLDGNAAKQIFALSNHDFFAPGNEIEIDLYYQGKEQEAANVFTGIVIKQKVKATQRGSLLQITLKDAVFKLTRQRKSAVYNNMKDSEIITAIFEQTKLPTTISVSNTNYVNEQMLQYQCSDWDFILKRAAANGLWLLVKTTSIDVQQPKLAGEPQHIFHYGIKEIFDFEMELDVSEQIDAIKTTAWSVEQQNLLPPKESKNFELRQGNLTINSTLAAAVGNTQFYLKDPSVLQQEEIQAWADAEIVKSRLAMLRGRLKVPGNVAIQLGDLIQILGIGDRFNGITIVTSVRHQVNEQAWQTDVQFGLPANWFGHIQSDTQRESASGLLPPVYGLQIGVVQDFEKDEQGQYRVKVKLPILQDDKNIIWARLAALDAGENRGLFIRPELGDEVVLGFFNNDPRQPVILGAMFSSKHPTPFEVTKENVEKGLVTKGNLRLVFNDEAKSIELVTPAGKKILLKETDKNGVLLADEHKNEIFLDAEGIVFNSSKNLTSTAQKNVVVKGQKIDTQ